MGVFRKAWRRKRRRRWVGGATAAGPSSTLAATLKLRRGLAAAIPTLADGEPYFTTDTHKLYVGYGGVNYLIGP